MSYENSSARRYHWLSNHVTDFVVEPHNAVVCNAKRERVLNMVAKTSEGSRKASVDLTKEPTRKLFNLIQSTAKPLNQKSLQDWLPKTDDPWKQTLSSLYMPRNINWETLSRAYEFQPNNYEELLSVKGVGSATVRGLAMVAELIYGEKPSWEDPVKFSFAYGGKDGVPYPVDREAMDESIQILKDSIQQARLGEKEKLRTLQRLRRFVPEDAKALT